jgi:osmotically inducible lipoprotein OsmB
MRFFMVIGVLLAQISHIGESKNRVFRSKEEKTMKSKAIAIMMVLVLLSTFLVGCSGMSRTEQRVLSGGAIGAGVGAGTSLITGGALGTNAAIGAAAGALGGFIFDKLKD